MKGLLKYISPLAPDISGAVSVVYELGGITVICDAGGCTGNVCGFDEPRWAYKKSAIFSAGLRDMDAIFGRDDRLIEKLKDTVSKTDCKFVTIVGTPVPAVIGTDYKALKRMAERRIGVPIVTIETTGTKLYDFGEELAYLQIFKTFAVDRLPVVTGRVGVLGATPLEVSLTEAHFDFNRVLTDRGYREVFCYGMGSDITTVQRASTVELNIVVSPSALKVAKYLKQKFGTPYTVEYPILTKEVIHSILQASKDCKDVLIVHQQVLANQIREQILNSYDINVTVATWSMLQQELCKSNDVQLATEEQYIQLVYSNSYDLIVADSTLKRAIKGYHGRYIELQHFAVSGKCGTSNYCPTCRIRLYGVVQGVGFRPFVSRTADSLSIKGTVANKGSYVEVFAQGRNVKEFTNRLQSNPPPRASILKVDVKELLLRPFTQFEIIESQKELGSVFVSPDIATCEQCKKELFNPKDRRYLHPFINCTACGPRLTILEAMPYDRERTSMKSFPMCKQCEYEYTHAETRRYDAQPVCCNSCGPEVYLVGMDIHGKQAISYVRRVIKGGGIVAIKGIGGFHLCCDATNSETVERLRMLKNRPFKPFAIMVKDVSVAERECTVLLSQLPILTGHQKPILLMPKSTNGMVCKEVAPNSHSLGVMLPYAPIQMLIFDYDDDITSMPDCLVMTSGNRSGTPICHNDDEAIQELSNLCDVILSNNRSIHIRADDTVMDYFDDRPYMIRRSRGYAPLPFILSEPFRGQLLAIGGELKNTFCLAKDNTFYPSAYLGDMADLRTVKALEQSVSLMKSLLQIEPSLVVCDMHPKYNTTMIANRLNLPVLQVQHHYAHVVSCMAENDYSGDVIGVSFDGTGYGIDGTIWGGEYLLANYQGFKRIGSIEPYVQAGGDLSTKEGWRIAVSMLYSIYGERATNIIEKLSICNTTMAKVVCSMIDRRINSVTSTSVGRLFDGVSAILGIKKVSTYEGDASTTLQYYAEEYIHANHIVLNSSNSVLTVDEAISNLQDRFTIRTSRIVKYLVDSLLDGADRYELAYKFHQMLAEYVVLGCINSYKITKVKTFALTGGVFQNRLLLSLCVNRLRSLGYTVLTNSAIPPNDGGICLGQAVVGMYSINNE